MSRFGTVHAGGVDAEFWRPDHQELADRVIAFCKSGRDTQVRNCKYKNSLEAVEYANRAQTTRKRMQISVGVSLICVYERDCGTGVESPVEVGAQVGAGQVRGRDVELAQYAAPVVRARSRAARSPAALAAGHSPAHLSSARPVRSAPAAAAAAAAPGGCLRSSWAQSARRMERDSAAAAERRRERRLARRLRRRLRLVVGVLGVLVLVRRPLPLRLGGCRPAVSRGGGGSRTTRARRHCPARASS